MLDAFGIGFRRFGRDAQRAQHVDDKAVTHPHPIGKRMSLLGEEYTTIGPRGGQPRAL